VNKSIFFQNEVELQSASCQSSFRKAMLNRHNYYRAKHGVPALSESSTLDSSALAWAETLASPGHAFEHSRTSGVGECLAYEMDSELDESDETCSRN
jgi:uncharacterized protein YkwD